jgi:two-component system chemotaxis sensor kinase CheA
MDELAALRATFSVEARDHLEELDDGLLRLQAGQTQPDVLDGIFRAAHSIKGGAGVVRWPAVVQLVHVVENTLDELRQGTRRVDDALVARLMDASGATSRLIDAAERGDLATPPWLHDQIAALKGASATPRSAAAGHCDWSIDIRPRPDMFLGCNDPLPVLQALDEVATCTPVCDLTNLPPLAQLNPITACLSWKVEARNAPSKLEVQALLSLAGEDCEIEVQPAPPRPSREAHPRKPSADTGTIRVPTERIDTVLDQVGELVVSHSMLAERISNLGSLPDIRESIQRIEHKMRELQESVLSMRMLPVRTLFERVPRLVYDLSRDLGKSASLQIRGETTEIDREVLQKLADPLVHLVRNAMDHGLEPPSERLAAGKPPEGTVCLEASHQAGNVVIRVQDDGRGLNYPRILAKAIERGLAPADARPSDAQIAEFIFEPGFSTADAVTDVSGRGVGMDVVRRNMEALGGRISLRSTPGQGSIVEIFLPLTLAILDGQVVRVSGETYIIPVRAIEACVKPDPRDRVHLPDAGPALYHRKVPIPLYRLSRLLGLPDGEGGLVVVADAGGTPVALEVDALGGHRQVVLKSLEKNYHKVPGIAGASILGDGRVVLVLDVAGLGRTLDHPPKVAERGDPPPAPDRILVIQSAGRRCGVDLAQVEAVRASAGQTRLPGAGPATLGAVNVRGEVIPLFDVRAWLGEPPTSSSRRIHILVRTRQAGRDRLVALAADEVVGIYTPKGTLQPLDSRILRGVYADEHDTIPLLHVDRALEAA